MLLYYYCRINVYEFWHTHKSRFDKLSLIANQVLCITTTATLSFDTQMSCPLNENQQFHSLNDPFDYIIRMENKENISRNALIRLNWKFV